MDGREAMASYHIYRGLGGGPGSGSHQQQQQQPGLHGIRPISSSNPSPNPNLQVQQSSGIGGGGGGGGGGGSLGSGFQVESPPSLSHHGVSVGGVGGGGGGLAGAVGQAEPLKRKRGRPRKYGPDGSVSLALSPMSPPASGMAAVSGSGTPGKRGRGRPPGTGRKQLLASLGEWVVGSAGMGFTPHVITISVGEDIATKIMSFSQQGPRAVCILSANGAVSTVTLRQPATSGGTVTYEGRFEILSLSGSYFMTEDGGSRSRSGGLSISLSSPDGRVVGGGVGGLLIAANTVQVIVGSFIYGGLKQKGKMKAGQESVLEAEHQIGDKPSPPSSGLPLQNPSPVMEWPGSRQMDMRNPHIGIDLTRG